MCDIYRNIIFVKLSICLTTLQNYTGGEITHETLSIASSHVHVIALRTFPVNYSYWDDVNIILAIKLTLFKVMATYLPKICFSLLVRDTSIATLLNAL